MLQYRENDISYLIDNYKSDQLLSLDIEMAKDGGEWKLVTVVTVAQKHFDPIIFTDEALFYSVCFLIQGNPLLGHNIGFDITKLRKYGLYAYNEPSFEDTLTASRLLYPQLPSRSLDKMTKKLCGIDYYADISKKKLQQSFDGNVLTEEQKQYAAADVVAVLELWDRLKPLLYDYDLWGNYHLAIASTVIALNFKAKPLNLDRVEVESAKWLRVVSDNTLDFNANSYQQTRAKFGTKFSSDEWAMQMIAHRPNGMEGYELTAKQVYNAVRTRWKAELKKETANPTRDSFFQFIANFYYIDNFDELVIDCSESDFFAQLGDPYQYLLEPKYKHSKGKVVLAERIMKYKKANKLVEFCDRALDNERGGRISAEWYADAVTGRKRPQNDNLSQYPRKLKGIWQPPEGCLFLYADYSQQELRSMCELSGDDALHEAYLNNADMHSATASMVKECLSEEQVEYILSLGLSVRQIAKKLNFLLLYGGGVLNLQNIILQEMGVWIEFDLLSHLVKEWRVKFQGIKEWQENNGKYTRTLGGRVMYSLNYTEQNNYQNQGSGADVSLRSMVLMKPDMDKYSMEFVDFVHDSFLIQTPTCDVATLTEKCRIVADAMNKAWRETIKPRYRDIKGRKIRIGGVFGDTPMPVDVFAGSCPLDEIEDNYILKYSLMYDPDTGKMLEAVL